MSGKKVLNRLRQLELRIVVKRAGCCPAGIMATGG
jgi:hypothetical protein